MNTSYVYPTIAKLSNFGKVEIEFTTKVYPPSSDLITPEVLHITFIDNSLDNLEEKKELEWEIQSITEEEMQIQLFLEDSLNISLHIKD